jgi:DNA-directed RNA polymerase specialized sigma subunit
MEKIIEFFEKAITIPDLMESKQREIARLKELAYSLSAVDTSGERVQTSRNIDCKYAELINKAADLEMELLEDTSELLDHQREVGRVIDKLSNPVWRVVMRDLYIHGLTVKEIAAKRSYSERRVYQIRGQSLEECKEFHLISEVNAI